MVDFLIFYEIGVREFDAISLLGYELQSRGYSVDYVGFEDTDINRYIKNRKLIGKYLNNVRIAVMPSLYNDEEIYNTVYYVCGKCKNIVNLRWEQYFEKYAMEDLSCVWFPTGLAKKAYHLCWGKKSYESLSVRGNEEKYLPITGAMQLDFLRPEFLGFYDTKKRLFSKYKLDYEKVSVLYISSFAAATMTERLQVKVQNDFNGEYDFRTDTFEFHRRSYELTIDWIEEFLVKHRNVQFIYRPHPVENVTDYITKLNKYKNFSIIMDGSVTQWILVCEVVTTWVSTSIAQAHFAGKNCFVVRPLEYPTDIDICYYSNVNAVDSLEDFLNITDGGAKDSIEPAVFEEYYDFDPDKAAYLKTADILESLILSSDRFPWDERQAESFDKRRKFLFIRNIVFYVYIGLLKMGLLLNTKYKVRFGKNIQSRIEGVRLSKVNSKYKQNQDLRKIVKKVERFLRPSDV